MSSTTIKVLQTLIEDGLTFSDVVHTFARYRSKKDVAYAEAAKRLFHEEGELEIDDTAYASTSETGEDEDGAYVMAWVWTPKEELNAKKDDEDEEG